MKRFLMCVMVILIFIFSIANAVTFSDLEGYSSDYVKAIMALSEKGAINGYPDGSYKPENNVTRAEAIKIIVSAFNIKLKEGNNISYSFDDVKGKWCESFVEIGASNGLLKGYEDGTFRPNNNVTCGELSAIICRVLDSDEMYSADSSDWATPYIEYLNKNEILEGIADADFVSKNNATRSVVALVTYNAISSIEKSSMPSPTDAPKPTLEPTKAPTSAPTVSPTTAPVEETDLTSIFKPDTIYCGRVTLERQRSGIDYIEVDAFDNGDITFSVKRVDKKPHYNSLIFFKVSKTGAVSLVKELYLKDIDEDYLFVESSKNGLVNFEGEYDIFDKELDTYNLNGKTIKLGGFDFFNIEMEMDKEDEYIFSDAKQVSLENLSIQKEDRVIFDEAKKMCYVIRGIEAE